MLTGLLLYAAVQAAPVATVAGLPDDTVRAVVHLAGSPASALNAPAPAFADSLVLDKSERRLALFSHGLLVKEYIVALGRNPVGDKLSRGDGRTPEGVFTIEGRNPQSKYHLALRISYPDAAHRTVAQRRGVSAGGDIMIHGLPDAFATVGALHRQQDWTEGCVALTNQEIEEIYRAVPDGARILIKP
ncbi:MAG TPA: L,D-transpeptidase family protein [Gemmatimonadaceae bacterium]|nr:L,D-transpeptidase family protein [Gemmatimonadaceae bacterium]